MRVCVWVSMRDICFYSRNTVGINSPVSFIRVNTVRTTFGYYIITIDVILVFRC